MPEKAGNPIAEYKIAYILSLQPTEGPKFHWSWFELAITVRRMLQWLWEWECLMLVAPWWCFCHEEWLWENLYQKSSARSCQIHLSFILETCVYWVQSLLKQSLIFHRRAPTCFNTPKRVGTLLEKAFFLCLKAEVNDMHNCFNVFSVP